MDWRWLFAFALVLASCDISSEAVGQWQVARELGQRGDTYFYHIEDGLHYHRSEQRDHTIYFKCIHYPRCPGRAVFDPAEGFDHTIPHNRRVCRPDIHYPSECEIRRRILERCRNLDYVSFMRIIDEEIHGYPIEIQSRFPLARLRTAMRNARLENFPALPHSLRDLTRILLNQQYRTMTMTEDGQDNIYVGSVTDAQNGHHVIFTSERLLQQMRETSVFHFDGTFKTVPAGLGIEQIFCIVGIWSHHVVPFAWILMESRSAPAYESVLRYFQHLLGPNIDLNRIIMDFEAAELLAAETVFGVRIQGCLWHLARLFLGYVGDRGLLRPMRLMEPVRRVVQLTMALALLPEHLIRIGMVLITREAMDEGHFIYNMVRPYLQDIYRIWLRSDRRIRRMCVFGSGQRTNNACECHNRVLRQALGVHPNIYAFICGLVRLEQRTWRDIYGLNNGRRVGRARRRSSIMTDDHVSQLAQDLLNPPGAIDRAIMRFLHQARHTMDGMVDEAMH